MRGLLVILRRTPLPFAFLAYAVLRAASLVGRPAGRFPDTDGWLTLTWWGENERFWPIPALFSFAGSDGARVALQYGIGTLAWIFLARTLATSSRFPRLIGLATLAVGLSPQVARWDLAILSESLSISFMVGAVAVTVRLARGTGGALPWIGAVTLFGLTRPTHLVILTICAAFCGYVAVRSRGARLAIPALVLIASSVWGVVLLRGNDATTRLNVYTVLARDVAVSDERWSWFVARGMPDVPGARDANGYDFAGALPDDLAEIIDLPVGQQPPSLIRSGGVELAEWVRDRGTRTLTRWILTHPQESLQTLIDRADATLSPSNDDFLPLEARQLVPRFMFGPWQLWAVVWSAALLMALVRGHAGRDVRTVAALGASVAAVYAATMLFSGIEHQRHAATAAAAVRVVALASCALALPARSEVNEDETASGGRGSRT